MSGRAGPVLVALAGLLGLSTVLLAAVGAHAVSFPDPEAAQLWNTANAMLGFHALAVLGIAALYRSAPSSWLLAATGLMLVGTALFCGTLLLRASGISAVPLPLPPLGGLLLMAGWICLGLAGIGRHPDGRRDGRS